VQNEREKKNLAFQVREGAMVVRGELVAPLALALSGVAVVAGVVVVAGVCVVRCVIVIGTAGIGVGADVGVGRPLSVVSSLLGPLALALALVLQMLVLALCWCWRCVGVDVGVVVGPGGVGRPHVVFVSLCSPSSFTWSNSTHGPPHEQWLVRLGTGAQSRVCCSFVCSGVVAVSGAVTLLSQKLNLKNE
jgi:hypothetical protein